MSEYTQDSARAGIAGLALIIIVVAVLALALVGWITDNVAQRAQAQVAIERAQQTGATERAEIFALTLASLTAMGAASGSTHLFVIGALVALNGGLYWLIWRGMQRRRGDR